MKYQAYKQGISPREFRHNFSRDWKDIMEIDNAMAEKQIRQAEINKAMAEMQW